MDTITHTLFGAVIYSSINKENMEKPMKRSLLFTALVGSLAPDIDLISSLWDHAGMYQMWHRGITHSIFAVPVFAIILSLLCYLFWKVKDRKVLYIGLLSVFIHSTSDLFNAWGTGYLEPFFSIRITFGTIPIIDFVFWTLIIGGFVLVKWRKLVSHKVFKIVGLLLLIHVSLQSMQGWIIYREAADRYEQLTLSAGFVPGYFSVIGKNGATVEISEAALWSKPETRLSLISDEDVDLEPLFAVNPAARTLYQWSPFVVVEDLPDRIAIFDPRFYRNGESFLREYKLK
jgi:inner membrane protein